MNGGAIRSQGSRRHVRNNNASPYSRPGSVASKKSSGWSLTGLLSYLNPLRPFTSSSEHDEPVENDAAQRLKERGEELAQSIQQQPPSPPSMVHQPEHGADVAEQQQQHQQQQHTASSQSRSPPQTVLSDQRTSPRSDDSGVSSSANLQKVQEFLDQKRGRPLNHIEFAGLVSLLQNSVEDDDDHQEPFRFSKSPTTPARGTTPTINFMSPSTSEQMVAAAGTAAQNGRKTLAKNPMGVYRWQGGGSARPRNRYQSPGFGSRVARPTIKLTPEKPKTDSKRRRVGEDATTSSPQRVHKPALTTSTSSSSTSSTVSMANGAQSNIRPNGAAVPAVPSTPRIRTAGTGVAKPTTPAVPSPLRQTWSQSDSPPQTSPSQPASKPTRAASFMTELLKEVTPPKKPDFANPYEAVSPLPRPAQKKQPVRKTRSAARAEAEKAEREKEKAKEKEPELTPQAIIEATVPKGSKRARPPPELIGQKSPEKRVTSPPDASSARRSTRLNGIDSTVNGVAKASTVSVTEVPEDEQPSPKKQRTFAVPSKLPRTGSFSVEEIDDVEMSSSAGSAPAPAQNYTRPSEVVEPGEEVADKKRATSPSSTPAFPGFPRATFPPAKSSAPKAPSKLRFSIQVEKDEKMDVASEPATTSFGAAKPPTPAAPVAQSEQPKDARTLVAAMREEDLPKYSFDFPLSSPGAGPSTVRAQEIAKAAPVSSLPTFDFSKDPVPVASATPKPAAPSAGFNWQAAGIKPPPKPAGDSWSCSVCMLSNPGGADKCTVCEAPREDKPKPAATQGFDWSKAGMKPPPKPAGDTWTCSVCMLSNPAGAGKCTVCDSPR
ncbi:hypothetical protein PYCCODRAFT_1434947 [Trametes coccinea BRFM310]|uniref:RanBP2-type domain-containing protein n=1 Tax=Trametes coccinea (strain BRFM310) TaxID=1353009 RepID=A0A1Y2IPL3_TRAC3|nr:hypothetical protein PYCCODRAFT_1434947 [Trametes coccinea BRFM310]